MTSPQAPKSLEERAEKNCYNCHNSFILADTEDWEKPLCNDCYEIWEMGVSHERARSAKLVKTVECVISYYDQSLNCEKYCDKETGHHEPECSLRYSLKQELAEFRGADKGEE